MKSADEIKQDGGSLLKMLVVVGIAAGGFFVAKDIIESPSNAARRM